MAKNTETTQAEPTEAPTEAAPAAPKEDKRHRKITVPTADGATREVNRTDYIRELWATGDWDRSAIRNHLEKDCSSADGSHVVKYQIVNAAVKDVAGGPSAEFKAKKEQAKAAAKQAKADAKAAAAAPAAETANA